MSQVFNRRRMGAKVAAGTGAAALGGLAATPAAAVTFIAGHVFTLTNQPAGNAVAVFNRAIDGALTAAGTVPTGGLGTGGGLGNQGALFLLGDRRLLAVNPGSNDVSVFTLGPNGLELTDRAPSGGTLPISVAAHNNLVYVLNDGGTANVSGLRLSAQGKLTPLAGSTRPLSTAAPDTAQVAFSTDGRRLVVTEKGTNLISTYQIGRDGLADGPHPQPSHGQTPFGFAFSPFGINRLIVSEAFGGAPDASAVSSYELRANGTLRVIDGSDPTGQTAACWIAITPHGRFVYTTNTGSGTVTGYLLGFDGQLTRIGSGVLAGAPGRSPIDAATDRHGFNLYVLNAGTDTIAAYTIQTDGTLVPVGPAPSVPDGATGLIAR